MDEAVSRGVRGLTMHHSTIASQSSTLGRALASMGQGDGKLLTLLRLGSLAHDLYRQGQGHYQTWRADRTYAISLGNQDTLYPDVHRWLLEQLPPVDHR